MTDELQRQLSVLTDTSKSIEQQYAEVKSALGTNEYRPPEPVAHPTTIADSTIYNPAVEWMLERYEYGEQGWIHDDSVEGSSGYPEYVPTDEAIKTLCTHQHILEIGAGNGYYSHVIRQNGGSCLPTDIEPIYQDYPLEYHNSSTEYPTTVGNTDPTQWQTTVWDYVSHGDHRQVQFYPDSAVLLCHPDPHKYWHDELLRLMHPNQPLILISEWYPGADAFPLFFHTLHTRWNLIDTFPIFNWEQSSARGYIFNKTNDASK